MNAQTRERSKPYKGGAGPPHATILTKTNKIMYIETKVKDGYITLPENDEMFYALPKLDDLRQFALSLACLHVNAGDAKINMEIYSFEWFCIIDYCNGVFSHSFIDEKELPSREICRIDLDWQNGKIVAKYAAGYETERDVILDCFEECTGFDADAITVMQFA